MVDADGMGVDTAAFLFRFPVELPILSDPGLLGGDSLTTGPRVVAALFILPKCPPLAVGP